MEKDACGCEKPKCNTHTCVPEPVINCTNCQTEKAETDKCGCVLKKCKDNVCQIHPTVACDMCNDVVIPGPDQCGCFEKPECVKIPCPTVTPANCDKCSTPKVVDDGNGCGCKESKCIKDKCPDAPLPECTPCQKVKEVVDDCGCKTYKCVKKSCQAYPTPECFGPCDKISMEKDACGCEKPICNTHTCLPLPDKNCTICQTEKAETDKCGCVSKKCQNDVCPIHPTAACDKCHDLVIVGPDQCRCFEKPECVKKPCITEAPITCDPVCEELRVEKDDCNCNRPYCADKLCPEPVMPECKPCEQVVNKTDQCGCLKLECIIAPCQTPEPPTCKECEYVETIKGPCGCDIKRCKEKVPSKECVVNGITHPLGSKWANVFDPKCSTCECVKGGKCIGAKIVCTENPHKKCKEEWCKEGEWYYPPTPEECANTCGPCCGKCGPPKCNAESGEVPAEKTVGLLKSKKGRNVPCTNTKEIRGLKRCTGACGLQHTETWMPNKIDTTCKCCKPKETENLTVRMDCEDGTHYNQVVKNPTVCDCLPCEADHGGSRRK